MAGLMIGLVCYGYHAIRIFVPVFLVAIVAVTWRAWWKQLRNSRGFFTAGAWTAGFMATFGPLAWQHIFNPKCIARHAYFNALWKGSETPAFKVQALLIRYISHFGPDFLFKSGDVATRQSPPDMGMLYWYMLPLMVVGLAVLIYRFRSSYPARLLLAFVLVYPAGDTLFGSLGLHALRSFTGSCSLVLLTAVGSWSGYTLLLKRSRSFAISVAAVLVTVVIYSNVQYMGRFFGEYNQRPQIRHDYNVALLEVICWLKPRLHDSDIVVWTTEDLNMPYVITLVALDYDPHRWFAAPGEYFTPREWDYCTRYGNMYFTYNNSFMTAVRQAAPDTRIYFVIRPGRMPLESAYRVVEPDGTESLWVCTALRSQLEGRI